MKEITISLSSVDKVKKFVNIISKYDNDFDISSDRYVVDAKSIMGIFSLDLGNTLKLCIHNAKDGDNVMSELQEFIV